LHEETRGNGLCGEVCFKGVRNYLNNISENVNLLFEDERKI